MNKKNVLSKKSKVFFLRTLMFILSLTSITLLGGMKVMAKSSIPNKIDDNTAVARSIAEEGMVLLKNDYKALPLKTSDKVGGLGIGQDSGQVFGGHGSGWVNSTNNINYRTGLLNASDNKMIKSYKAMSTSNDGEYDKVLYFISRTTTEGGDQVIGLDGKGGANSYYLTNTEKNDIASLINKYGKEKIVIILNVGAVVDTTWLIEKDVASIVLAYYGGEQAGVALANVLTGKSNFSGKTVDTWAKKYEDYPSSTNFGNDKYTNYEEDIFVGYRYFSTFDPQYQKVNYSFGYGLSYTKFDLSQISFKINSEKIVVSVNVKNIGDVKGKEVVQVYVNKPNNKIGTAKHELITFGKTKELAPNESETIELEFKKTDLASFDDQGIILDSSWVLESGKYNFYVGNSIKDAANRGSIGYYEKTDDLVVESVTKIETSLGRRLLSNGSYQTLNQVTKQTAHIIPSAGSVYIQAEDYIKGSKQVTSEAYYKGLQRGFGVGNLNVNGRFLEYEVDVKEVGEYSIAFNMASAWDGQSNMFTLTIDGVKQDLVVSMDATHQESDKKWYENTYLTKPIYKINFTKKGKQKIRFTGNGTMFMNFDSFVIFNNKISSDEVTKIEAENYSKSNGERMSTVDGAATAPALAVDKYYEYNLNVQKAGSYDLRMVVANVLKAHEEAIAVYVNDEIVDYTAVKRTSVKGTNSFISNNFTYTDTDSIRVELPSGDINLKFVTMTDGIACIDYFTLRPYDESKIVTGIYYDNTDELKYIENTDGKILDELITYEDLMLNPELIEEFLTQLNIKELATLAGLYFEQNDIQTGVGGIGGLQVDSKYQIPSAYAADGPAGIRYVNNNLYSTWFPCMTLLASTWNTEIAYNYGEAVAKEAILGGVNIWLAPGINIHRNPLTGRNFEYFSEDPLVTGLIGGNIVKGAENRGVAVSVKHYAANNQETNRNGNSSQISARALREIYLKAFEIIIKDAKPRTIMSSYNLINDEHVAASKTFMTDILRNDFGFEGIVLSDWDAHANHVSMLLAGNTIKSFNANHNELVQAFHNGIISREQLELNAKEVIEFLLTANLKNDSFEQKINVISKKVESDGSNSYIDGAKYTLEHEGLRLYYASVSDYGWYKVKIDKLKQNSIYTLKINNKAIDLSNVYVYVELNQRMNSLIVKGDFSEDNINGIILEYVGLNKSNNEDNDKDDDKPIIIPDEPKDPIKKTKNYTWSIIGGVTLIIVVTFGIILYTKKKRG